MDVILMFPVVIFYSTEPLSPYFLIFCVNFHKKLDSCRFKPHHGGTMYAKFFWGSAPNPTVYAKFFWGSAPNPAKGAEPLWNPAIWGEFVFNDLFIAHILG